MSENHAQPDADVADRSAAARRRWRRTKWAVRSAALLVLVGAFFVGCDSFFYYPERNIEYTPSVLGLDYEDVTFQTSDGLRLHGWFLPARGPAKATVVHFHGNAVNIGNHIFASAWLVPAGFNLLVFDYRGYGRSEGKPTRAGTIRDGHAALDYLLSRDDVDPRCIVAFGQSLGGAVACVVAAERSELRAVVLDSTFGDYREIAARHLRNMTYFEWPARLLAKLLISDGYDPVDYVGRISPRPLLVIAAAQDEICYPELGRRLFDAAGEPKQWLLLPEGRHLESVSDNVNNVQQVIVDFYTRAVAGQ